jgi:Flp pilus assembly protein TadG
MGFRSGVNLRPRTPTWRDAHRNAAGRSVARSRGRGQSLAEFAIVLPVMLAFLGLALDFSRVFQAWITIESATRDAAELVATDASTATEAQQLAQRAVCLQAQNVPGFQPSSSPAPADVERCVAPVVVVVSFDVSSTAPGASTRYPLGIVTIESRMPFRPLLIYPFIGPTGTWTVVSRSTFSIIQGRQ